MSHNDQLATMVSSTIYGIEDLLDRIYAPLVASSRRQTWRDKADTAAGGQVMKKHPPPRSTMDYS
ncbi:MAG TPA: hypothetical protein VH575_34800 [Gemmataceae bacterium]|jgi:hypothetical protein